MPLTIIEDGSFDQNEQRPAWSPVKGESIHGVYMGSKENLGSRGSTIYNLKLDDGSVQGVWSNHIIRQAFQNISVGDYVVIVFLGKGNTKNGNTINRYAIATDHTRPSDAEIREFISQNGGSATQAPAVKSASTKQSVDSDGDMPF